MNRALLDKAIGGTLYEAVASHIAKLIESGTLCPGERTPSVRQLRRQLSVSASTVMEAYRLLESRGLVRARPQSGYFVRGSTAARGKGRSDAAASTLPEPSVSRPSPLAEPVAVADLAASLAARIGHSNVLQLGPAVPAADLLPVEALSRLYGRLARRSRETVHGYITPPGYLPLRRQIARRLIDAGCNRSPDDILITHGATEAVHLCLRAITRPGDVVAVESPTYYGSLEAIESLGLRAQAIPTSAREGMDLDALERALHAGGIRAILISCNFANPLGSIMSDDNKRRLIQLAKTYRLPVIDDDIYGDLAFDEERPAALAAFDDEGWVLAVGSLSKTVSPGLRIGWCCPGRFAGQVLRLKLAASHANAGMAQLVAATFLAEGRYERQVRRLRRYYAQQAERFREVVVEAFPSTTRVTKPRGGHVLWIEAPVGVDSLRLYDRALTHRISIAPGPLFSATGEHRHCLRLNLAVPWSGEVKQALSTLGTLLTVC
jgi:DNA-binding transcriptional MocR family regulator